MANTGLPSLIIGVGGTGLRVLQRVKERLIETYYGAVPSQITLLEFDTALQAPNDNFCGVQLSQSLQMGTLQEMRLIQTNTQFTMDHAMTEARSGNAMAKRWDWMEVNTLDRLLSPAQRVIIDGAGAFRPVGRTAFFLNYGEVEQQLRAAMQQVVREPVSGGEDALAGLNDADTARSKRNIFIVSSFAGGTGSGGFLDIAAIIRALKDTDNNFVNIQMIGIITLPRFFANVADDLGRRVPNTYAGLREVDRFMLAHRKETPYSFTGGHHREVTISNALFDLCYLVDTDDYQGVSAGPTPDFGALPAIVDMIVAHTDLRLGLRLNAANINVTANFTRPMTATGNQYAYQPRRLLSSLNSHTIIFPREDVARSLSYRFLLEFIDTHLVTRNQQGQPLMPNDPVSVGEALAYLANSSPSAQDRQRVELEVAGDPMDMGIFVRFLLDKQDGRYDTAPESVMKWLVEDGEQRRTALETIQRSINETSRQPADSKNMNAYLAKGRNWLDTNLGPLVDPNNAFGDRSGGEWDAVTQELVNQQRSQLESYVQKLVLRLLNQREEKLIGDERTSLLRPNRVGYALGILRALKEATRKFIRQTDLSFGDAQRNLIQLRRDLEEQKARVTQFRGGFLATNPGPVYLSKLKEVAEAERQRLLRNLSVAMANEFGGDIAEQGRSRSVLDSAITELETWVKGLARVRELVAQAQGRHEAQRKQKYAIQSRSYITDPARFPKAATVEESLYTRYRPIIWRTLLGPDPMGASGPALLWAEASSYYFDYKIITKHKDFKLHPNQPTENHALFAEASGPDEIAQRWMEGSFRLLAEQARNDKDARVAAYIKALYRDQSDLINRSLTPHSRALAPLHGVAASPSQEEHYLAVDFTSDDQSVSGFYQYFTNQWQRMNQTFLQAESEVACSFVTLYHGLELDHFRGFQESERSYRAMEQAQGALHLFAEERQAAIYEAQIANANRRDWPNKARLHPDVVAGLRDQRRVRSFALALVAGLIKDVADGYSRGHELHLPNKHPIKLTNTSGIANHHLMGGRDNVAARLLQAFQAYTLLGHGIDDERNIDPVNYQQVDEVVKTWLRDTHRDLNREQASALLTEWERAPEAFGPLFQSESQDPRFRDLGMVLATELAGWRDLYN